MLDWTTDAPHRRVFLERFAASTFGLSVLSYGPPTVQGTPGPEPAGKGFKKAKRVIFLMIAGGLSHIDTFDPKAGDSKGPGDPVRTRSGTAFTSYLPETAKASDKICLIRSMTAKIGTHREAQYYMRTAFKPVNTIMHPMLGAWAQELLGKSHQTLPSTVAVGRDAGAGNGFLPSSMSPLPILDPDAGLQYLRPAGGLDQLQSRLRQLDTLDGDFRGRYPDRNVKAYTDFYDASVRMMGGKDGDAFDLSRESSAVREAYGKTKFGQGCLLARRLVEHGVRFVEVHFNGWDFHKNLVPGLAELAPELDKGYAQLLRDLAARGLLDDTLVVLTTEFGRSPGISNGGRNHYPPAFSSVLAGAGVKGGYVYGATDTKGGEVIRDPVTTGQLHATIGWAMGITPKMEIKAPNGRPFSIGDKSQPVLDLYA